MNWKCGLMICAVVSYMSLTCVAAPILDEGTGWSVDTADDASPPQHTTVLSDNLDTVWFSGVPGGDTTGVAIQGPATTDGSTPYDDLITESGDMTFGAGLSTSEGVNSVMFDFYIGSATYSPQLSVFFETGDTFRWYFDLGTPSGAGWHSYTVWFSQFTPLDTSDSMQVSLDNAGLSLGGIKLIYENDVAEPQRYGIGNFKLDYNEPVPEPGTYVVLSTALMSLGYTFARRRAQKQKKV